MIGRIRYAVEMLMLAMAGLLMACGPAGDGPSPAASPATAGGETLVAPPTPVEEREYRYNSLLARDSIRPVYEPEFVPADEAPLEDDELVLAIEIDGEAKAYPISVLNFREMVNDELAGVPILATW